jgi:hypothetical protein
MSLGRKSLLPQDAEDRIAQYRLVMEERLSDARQLAFRLALKNKL